MMQSDAKNWKDDWTGTETRPRVEPGVAPAGMGGIYHYATLILDQMVLGGVPSLPPVGSLTIKFGLYDLERWLEAALEQVRAIQPQEYAGIRPAPHGG